MTYYDTIEEDLARAKQILANGKAEPFMLGADLQLPEGGTIFGQDIYAAYKLLESFVAHIEAAHSDTADLLAQEARMGQVFVAGYNAGLATAQQLVGEVGGETAETLLAGLEASRQ